MKQTIVFNSVLNGLSIGQTSYNFLRAMFRRDDIDVKFHPIENSPIDIENLFPTEDFRKKLQHSIDTRFDYNLDDWNLQLWHINGSQSRLTNRKALFTFHETSRITEVEKSLLDKQDLVLTSSSESVRNFIRGGVKTKVAFAPLGLDEDIKRNGKDYKFGEQIHWILCSKIEKRKNTEMLLKVWARMYGNNPKYQLSCAIYNNFIKPEDFNNIINRIFEGKVYSNINILPYLNCRQMVDMYNSGHLDITGLSLGEGFGLPQFNFTCLGGWSAVSNCAAHKDWATKENCVLVDVDGMQKAHDGMFFHEGSPFNQGDIYYLSPESVEKAFKELELRAKTPNQAGEEMGRTWTYDAAIDKILKEIRQ